MCDCVQHKSPEWGLLGARVFPQRPCHFAVPSAVRALPAPTLTTTARTEAPTPAGMGNDSSPQLWFVLYTFPHAWGTLSPFSIKLARCVVRLLVFAYWGLLPHWGADPRFVTRAGFSQFPCPPTLRAVLFVALKSSKWRNTSFFKNGVCVFQYN